MTTYTWTDNAMQSGSSCDVNKVNENLMHLKYDNLPDVAPKHLVPQCVNTGKLVNGQTNAIGAGSGLRPQIQAATVNMTGNNQSGETLKKFILNSDFNIPKDAPANKRSSVVLLNGSTGTPSTDAAKWDYACQRRLRGNLPQKNIAQNNLLMDFNSSLTYDYYGNSVTVLGNPTLSSGKYVGDGTGDGLKCTTITTLGNDKWTIEGRFKFTGSAKSYDTLFRSKTTYGFWLARGADNKLILFASANGSSWGISDSIQGTKADFDNTSEYHIAIEFNGSTYKVYVNGVLDITVTSSSTIYSSLTAFIVGLFNDESSHSLAGTMDDIRVTIGYNRYGTTFTPPAAGSLTMDNIVPDYTPTNLFMDFSSSLTEDKYNNTVSVIGNPTLSGGKYVGDGSGDGLKCSTITTLGQDKWCIEGRFKQNDLNQGIIIGASSNYGIRLYFGSRLLIYLSSNGSSDDIANGVQGSKTDFNTTNEYHIALEFDGNTYKVYVDGVADISITSSSKIYSILTALLFGINGVNTQSLNGTIDDLRVTIGNVRYGAAGFTPPAVGSLSPDQYWEDTNTGKMYYGSPASWTEVEAVFLGEINTNASAVTDSRTYAYNRYEESAELTAGQAAGKKEYTHNIGFKVDPAKVKTKLINKIPEIGYTIDEEVNGYDINSSYSPIHFYSLESSTIGYATAGGFVITSKTGTPTTLTANNWKQKFIIDER